VPQEPGEHRHLLGEMREIGAQVAARERDRDRRDAQREALHLAYYRGLSQREIAAQTGIPLGTIKTRLELAVRKVRAAILSLGGAEEWALSHN